MFRGVGAYGTDMGINWEGERLPFCGHALACSG